MFMLYIAGLSVGRHVDSVMAYILSGPIGVLGLLVFIGPIAASLPDTFRYDDFDSPTRHQGIAVGEPNPQKPVSVMCHEASMEIVVKAYLFGPGTVIDEASLRLGSETGSADSCAAVASGEAEFTIVAKLSECGTRLFFTEDALVYANQLTYLPVPHHILRRNGAVFPIECHYQRWNGVSSQALRPTWVQFVASQAAEDVLYFTLKLMSDDWLTERASGVYFLGEMMYLEAAVFQAHHGPLRVYVDSCVATPVPDWNASPKYAFIENSGCLTDAELTGSGSQFLPRVWDDKLQIMLPSFLFWQDASNLVYIACWLKAVPVSDAGSSHRACSFIEGSWRSADGMDQVCDSCQATPSDTTPPSNGRGTSNAGLWKRGADARIEWQKVTLGPISVQTNGWAGTSPALMAGRALPTEQTATFPTAEMPSTTVGTPTGNEGRSIDVTMAFTEKN